MAGLDHLQQLGLDILERARTQLSDIQHHVDLPGAAAKQVAGLVELRPGGARAVRESSHAADGDIAARYRPMTDPEADEVFQGIEATLPS